MDFVNAAADLIPKLGFPVVCVIGLAIFCWKMFEHLIQQNKENMAQVQKNCKEREEKLYSEIKENREINRQAIETIAKYSVKIDDIQKDVKDIKEDIIVIKSKE